MERRRPRSDACRVRLRHCERHRLRALTSSGNANARVLKRARILLLLDHDWAPVDVPAAVGCGEATVRRIRRKYEHRGLDAALFDKPRPGPTPRLSEKQAATIVAMVCADPPMGCARWTIRLVAEQAMMRGLVEAVGREIVRVLLRAHDLKPWREK